MRVLTDGDWTLTWSVEPDGRNIRLTVSHGNDTVAAPTFPARKWPTFALWTLDQFLRRPIPRSDMDTELVAARRLDRVRELLAPIDDAGPGVYGVHKTELARDILAELDGLDH